MQEVPISELEARLVSASAPPVDPVKRIDALALLAWEIRNADQGRAHALATEARELAMEHGYKLGQARAARTMAVTLVDIQGLSKIFALGEEAMRLFDEVDDGPGRAASRDFLAGIFEYLGDLAAGLEYALDALSIAREVGDPIRQGYALCNVGGILAASGEVDEGIARLEEALQLFESAQKTEGIGTICSKLSKIHRGLGQIDQAWVYAERCRDVAQDSDNPGFSRAVALTALAELQDQRGNAEEAEQLYRAALDSYPATARKAMGPSAQVALGRVLIKRGAIEAAEPELNEALQHVQEVSISIVDEAAAHEALAELSERQGKLTTAIEHLRKAQVLRDRISQQDARNKLAQVEVRADMQAAKKDAEIHKLRFVELHAMQSKLVEAEKTALLGTLAAGTAHELNTPLGVLQSNTKLYATAAQRLASLAQERTELGSQAAKLVGVIEACRETSEQAIERIAAIAQSFGRFTRLDQAERRAFDVVEGLDSALALLEPTLADEIQVERCFEKVPNIEGWPRELNHAFMTVLQNAAQAIAGAGVITAETGTSKDRVLVRVHDTGRGMSKERSANLFDVAWSEDGQRTRMRLGLSAAYSTTQKHGGTLDVQSTLGQGTTVTFSFPIPQT